MAAKRISNKKLDNVEKKLKGFIWILLWIIAISAIIIYLAMEVFG